MLTPDPLLIAAVCVGAGLTVLGIVLFVTAARRERRPSLVADRLMRMEQRASAASTPEVRERRASAARAGGMTIVVGVSAILLVLTPGPMAVHFFVTTLAGLHMVGEVLAYRRVRVAARIVALGAAIASIAMVAVFYGKLGAGTDLDTVLLGVLAALFLATNLSGWRRGTA